MNDEWELFLYESRSVTLYSSRFKKTFLIIDGPNQNERYQFANEIKDVLNGVSFFKKDYYINYSPCEITFNNLIKIYIMFYIERIENVDKIIDIQMETFRYLINRFCGDKIGKMDN